MHLLLVTEGHFLSLTTRLQLRKHIRPLLLGPFFIVFDGGSFGGKGEEGGGALWVDGGFLLHFFFEKFGFAESPKVMFGLVLVPNELLFLFIESLPILIVLDEPR